jgi:hypothetical protein
VAGCSSSGKSDGGTSGGSSGYAAAHVPLPVVPKGGGVVFSAPQVVAVTFDDDPNQIALESFSSWLVGSLWFQTVGQQYGVGLGTSTNADLSDEAPDPLNMEEYLTLELRAGNLPSPGPQTLYLVYYSAAASNCPELAGVGGGYHSNFSNPPSTQPVVFAVVQNCPIGALSGLQAEQLEASHELIETTTDPLFSANSPSTTAGYQILDTTNPFSAWGGAVAELCAFPTCPVPPDVDSSTGYLTTRVWSNAAAATNAQQPCIPSWTEDYFNVSPSPNTPQTVAPGASVTFTLTGWSVQPLAAPWTVEVVPSGLGFTPTLSFTQNTMHNGQTLDLTVTVPATAIAGVQTIVYVYSGTGPLPADAGVEDAGSPYVSYWPLVITVG